MPGGTTRTPAASRSFFSGTLSWNSKGPTSIIFISETAKKRRIASFTQAFTLQPSAPFSATRSSPASSSASVSRTASAYSGSFSFVRSANAADTFWDRASWVDMAPALTTKRGPAASSLRVRLSPGGRPLHGGWV